LLVALCVAEELFEAEARHGGRLAFAPSFAIAAGTLLLSLLACSVASGSSQRAADRRALLLRRILVLSGCALVAAVLIATWFANTDAPALFENFADSIPT
jgi:hypothetical protein